MKIKNHIFGSNGESELYRTLRNNWPRWPIYPQLPFQAIIDFESSPSLSEQQKAFLRRTSVDYTFCGKDYRPILSIEFDGLGEGFSRHAEYVQDQYCDDAKRKLKFDLKLRVCREADYPLFIVSSAEKQSIGPELLQTVVDGIVGQVLSQRYFEKKSVPHIHGLLEQKKDSLSRMSPEQEMDYVGGMFSDFKMVAEATLDPIVKKAEEYEILAYERGIPTSYTEQRLYDPKLPEIVPWDIGNVTETLDAIKSATRVGCRLILRATGVPIIQTTWVRNFDDRWVFPYHVAKNIATLLLFRRAVELGTGKPVAVS